MTENHDQGPEPVQPETAAVLGGRADGESSLAPVLYPTSTFAFESVDEGRRLATAMGPERFYSRYGNPTINAFESTIADLEGAEAARAFASGMGAVSAVVLGICSSGDHVVAQRQLYAGTQLFLQTECPRMGIDVTFVDGTAPSAFAEAVVPGRTMLVIAETPANPRLDLVDLDFFIVAMPYTLLDQGVLDNEFPRCQERDVGIVIGSPFASGILVTGPVEGARYAYDFASEGILEKTRRIQTVCQRHDVPLPCAAIHFALAHPSVAAIIPGGFQPDHVRQNLAAHARTVPADLWTELQAEGLLRADAPTP